MANILPLRRIKIYLQLEIIIFLGDGSSRHPGNTYGSEREARPVPGKRANVRPKDIKY